MNIYLNELFFIHQRTLMRAAATDQCDERSRLHGEADKIASEISVFQEARGANVIELLPAAAI